MNSGLKLADVEPDTVVRLKGNAGGKQAPEYWFVYYRRCSEFPAEYADRPQLANMLANYIPTQRLRFVQLNTDGSARVDSGYREKAIWGTDGRVPVESVGVNPAEVVATQ